MKKRIVVLFVLVGIFSPVACLADLIDFESYSDGDYVGTVITATNEVSFYDQKNSQNIGQFALLIEETITGDPSGLGTMYLTDQNPQGHPESYYIQFETPVYDISLDLFDFEISGATATLTAYTNYNWTGTTSASVAYAPGGNLSIVSMSVPDTTSYFGSLILSFSPNGADNSTGIDNLAFTSAAVPEPATIFLLGMGAFGIAGLRRRKQKE